MCLQTPACAACVRLELNPQPPCLTFSSAGKPPAASTPCCSAAASALSPPAAPPLDALLLADAARDFPPFAPSLPALPAAAACAEGGGGVQSCSMMAAACADALRPPSKGRACNAQHGSTMQLSQHGVPELTSKTCQDGRAEGIKLFVCKAQITLTIASSSSGKESAPRAARGL